MSGYHDRDDSQIKRVLSDDNDDGAGEGSAKRLRAWYNTFGNCLEQAYPQPAITLRCAEYTVGWICALSIEMAVGRAMFDRIHENIPTANNDTNQYFLGSIAIVASNMLRSFPSIRIGLMVGIGGGVPGDADIRLGDVVVGTKVIQYDLGKIIPGNRVQRTGTSRLPPHILLNAVSKLRALHETTRSNIPSILQEMYERYPSMVNYSHPSSCEDRLFHASYDHVGSLHVACRQCSASEVQHRTPRDNSHPKIHYGGIASGNLVIKDGTTRDALAKEFDIMCFEMEAAGLMDTFPCIPVRGICDYADSHKNKEWQNYAAATAAACAKELLSVLNPSASDEASVAKNAVTSVENALERLQAHRKEMLDLLRFEQIDSRHETIKTAQSKTCEWLLNEDFYKDWLDPSQLTQHHGFLWISGKPGAGKSTIMKFAFSRAKRSQADTAVASFFFNARGDNLEKSTIGLYRSLLLQLLERFPDLQTVLDELTLVPPQLAECPSLETLRNLFRNAIMKLGQRQMTCFVDALDECDEEQVQEMIYHFEELGEEAITNNIQLRICLSSRHYPHINTRNGLKTILEDQPGHGQDLKEYVQSRLRAGTGAYVDKIRTRVLDKAGGVFMWVVLVVEVLNKEFTRGRMFAVEKRLNEIPNKLGELFKDILRRDNDNMEDLLLCIQWILFARRPLNRSEFYFAMLSGIPDCDDDLRVYDPERITDEAMDLFVTSSSKGLAEVTKSRSKTIQFIHESVKDFLIKDKGFQELWPGLGVHFQSLSHEKLKQCCYSNITFGISRHLSNCDTEPLPKANSDSGESLRKEVAQKFPFLVYATQHVLYHADKAVDGVSQDDFLDSFALENWVHLSNILKKHEIRRHGPGITLAYILAENNFIALLETHIQRHPHMNKVRERYGYPFFAALANGHWLAAKTLLGHEASSIPCEDLFPPLDYKKDFDNKRGLKTSPLRWALENHHLTLARMLIRSKHGDFSTRDSRGRSILHVAAEFGDEGFMTLLSEEIANFDLQVTGQTSPLPASRHANRMSISGPQDALVNATDNMKQSPLLIAAKRGHEPIMRLLLHLGSDLDARDFSDSTPLYHAAGLGHESIARLLVERGSDVNHGDFEGRTALLVALNKGHENIVNMLFQNGARIRLQGDQEIQSLVNAAHLGDEKTLRFLVDNGVRLNSTSLRSWQFLQHAALTEHHSAVRLLLEHEAFTELPGCDNSLNPLHVASIEGHENMAKCLINGGARIDDTNQHGQTALHLAATYYGGPDNFWWYQGTLSWRYCDMSGQLRIEKQLPEALYRRKAIVKLLIDSEARIDIADKNGFTALHCAAACGLDAIVELLIEGGADIDGQSHTGRTPMHLAAFHGHKAVVKLLIDHEARIDSINQVGRTPIHLAAHYGHEAVIQLFIESGTAMDNPDIYGQTALHLAASYGHGATVRLLLDHGGLVDRLDHCGQTPIHLAAFGGHDHVIKLLIEYGAGLNIVNSAGETPYRLAVMFSRKTAAQLLLEHGSQSIDSDLKNGT